jgi:hypothetical protein
MQHSGCRMQFSRYLEVFERFAEMLLASFAVQVAFT